MALCLRGRHFRKGVWASSSNIEVHNQRFYQRILCKHLHIFTYSDGSITKPFYNVFDRVQWIPHGLRASIGLQQSLPIFACAAPLLCIFTALHRQLYFHIYNTSKSSARVEQYHMTILTHSNWNLSWPVPSVVFWFFPWRLHRVRIHLSLSIIELAT